MTNFRILDKDYKIKYTGSNTGSWFSIDNAKVLVDYSKGEKIYEYDMSTMRRLHEIL